MTPIVIINKVNIPVFPAKLGVIKYSKFNNLVGSQVLFSPCQSLVKVQILNLSSTE